MVKMVSERLSARLKRNVVVTAGIHWDHLDHSAIAKIMDNCSWLTDRIGEVVEREG